MVLDHKNIDETIVIYAVDRNQISSRPIIKMNRLGGDKIEIYKNSPEDNVQHSFALYFNKMIEEEHFSKACSVYPNDENSSFKDCDDKFVQKSFEKYGLNPVWAADTSRNITTNVTIENGHKLQNLLSNIVNGVTTSECKVPCTTIFVTTRL